jgi:hypothetical protein
MDKLQKLSKKLKLNKEVVEGIILYNHELNNFIPKKELKEVNFYLNSKSSTLITKVARALKVDEDAVIGYILKEQTKKGNL